jgi:hypothetical protein
MLRLLFKFHIIHVLERKKIYISHPIKQIFFFFSPYNTIYLLIDFVYIDITHVQKKLRVGYVLCTVLQ